MTMIDDGRLQQLLKERQRLAASRGFTMDYQRNQELGENVVCQKDLAPATNEKHEKAAENWML